MLGHEAVLQVIGIVLHRRQDAQAEEQQQRRERDAHEERREVAEVPQEDAQAEAGREAQALGQRQAALGAGFAARLVAQELQRRLAHLAKKPDQRDAHEHRHGDHRRLDHDAPAPAHVKRRQAVGAVVEILHGDGEDVHAQGHADARGEHAHDARQQQVVGHELAAPVAARQQRADDGALLLDGRRGEDHEHERHDHDDDLQQHDPHGRVAGDVLGRVADALVGVGVEKVVHARVGVGECAHHVPLDVGAFGHAESAVVEDVGIGVGGRGAGLLERSETGVGDLGHAEAQGVHGKGGVVLEKRLAVGLGHDAHDAVCPAGELDRVAHGQVVVRGEDAVDGHLVVGLGYRALAVGGDVHLGAVDVGAQPALIRVLGAGLGERRVDGEVLIDCHAAGALGRPRRRVELCVRGLEGGRKAAVLDHVFVAHAVHDDFDGVRCQKEPRGQGDGAAHEQEDAQVLAQVVLELAREPLEEGRHCPHLPFEL